MVRGPVTGNHYHFAGQGATVAVDPRDRPSLTGLARLRELRRL
jgi:hypothetical protein